MVKKQRIVCAGLPPPDFFAIPLQPPASCQLTSTVNNDTYQFDLTGRVTHIARHTPRNDLDYLYAYQGKQATVEVTYPRSGASELRFH